MSTIRIQSRNEFGAIVHQYSLFISYIKVIGNINPLNLARGLLLQFLITLLKTMYHLLGKTMRLPYKRLILGGGNLKARKNARISFQ